MFWPPYFIGEKKWSQQKITFECSLIAQNPFQTHFRTLKNFENFFQKIRHFYVSALYYLGEKKWSQQKITFECSFIAQNPFQTILVLQKILKIFFKKFEFFICFDPHTS